ncbi:MAG: ABC transporter ATP-binding protein [Nitrososphaerales archaeon]|jgi:ABC-2 type transport system ATP-binding protein
MIETEGLTRKFGDLTAVDDLTLRVNDGEVFGFLGPNGAGKTTTVRMLCCLISKTSGSARVSGYEVGDRSDSVKIRRLIGFVSDNVGLYDSLTAYENLDYFGKLYKCPEPRRKENIERFLRMLGLWEKRDVPAGTLSKGMKQKVAIARALVHDPDVLFMDEPTANLDPESAKTVREFILQLKKEKKTIFLNTHNLDEAQRICDKIGVLNTRLMALGTPQELEYSVGARKTVILLDEVNDAILNALNRLSPGRVTHDGSALTIELSNPNKENPAIIRAIVGAGGNVQSVSIATSSLEDAYLKLVRGKRG